MFVAPFRSDRESSWKRVSSPSPSSPFLRVNSFFFCLFCFADVTSQSINQSINHQMSWECVPMSLLKKKNKKVYLWICETTNILLFFFFCCPIVINVCLFCVCQTKKSLTKRKSIYACENKIKMTWMCKRTWIRSNCNSFVLYNCTSPVAPFLSLWCLNWFMHVCMCEYNKKKIIFCGSVFSLTFWFSSGDTSTLADMFTEIRYFLSSCVPTN